MICLESYGVSQNNASKKFNKISKVNQISKNRKTKTLCSSDQLQAIFLCYLQATSYSQLELLILLSITTKLPNDFTNHYDFKPQIQNETTVVKDVQAETQLHPYSCVFSTYFNTLVFRTLSEEAFR